MLKIYPRISLTTGKVTRGFATKKAAPTPKPSAETKIANNTLLHQAFADKVAEFEHKDAFRHIPGKIRWTYIELDKHTDILGHVLFQNNMIPKTKLLLLLGNDLEAVTSNVAATKVGVIPSHAPTGLESEQIDHLLREIQPKTVVLHTKSTAVENIDKLLPQLARANEPRDVSYPWQYPFLKAIWHINKSFYNGMLPLYNLTKDKKDVWAVGDYAEDVKAHPTSADAAVITSKDGTEVQKISHAQLISAATSLSEKLSLGRNDRIGLASQFGNPASQVAFWAGIHSGSVSIVPSLEFNVDEIIRAFDNEKATVVVGSEEQVNQLVSAGIKQRVATLQKIATVSPLDLQTTVHQ
ncbi:hypothetical protein PROFUN_03940 [Planoprotostelium fungivorum]|uniref:AMP-dependent synthetase/ligase domain-containing protein n=1 Tax=Planoprotostelium fungivorum TaxID=1890364 RepID=A0A2P6MTU8_9EUKA|nr:hypothetical protein PROFUN_03940 [Planoprotostelium fungivorum]